MDKFIDEDEDDFLKLRTVDLKFYLIKFQALCSC